jgi:hypothetical protein
MSTVYDLAEDALFIRYYCVKLVRRINADLRRYGPVVGWIAERDAVHSVLRLFRKRKHERRNAAGKEAR